MTPRLRHLALVFAALAAIGGPAAAARGAGFVEMFGLARTARRTVRDQPEVTRAVLRDRALAKRLVGFARANPDTARTLLAAGHGAAGAPIATLLEREPTLVGAFLDAAPPPAALAALLPAGPGAAARVDHLVGIANQRPQLARSALALTVAEPRTWGVFARALDQGVVDAAIAAPGGLAEHVVDRARAKPAMVATLDRALDTLPSRAIKVALRRPTLIRRAVTLTERHPGVVDRALTEAQRHPELAAAVLETGSVADGVVALALDDPGLARRGLDLIERQPALARSLARFVRSGAANDLFGPGGVPQLREVERLLTLAERAPGAASLAVDLARALPRDATALALAGSRLVPPSLLRLGASVVGRVLP